MTTATDTISVDQFLARPPERVHMSPGWSTEVLPRLVALLAG